MTSNVIDLNLARLANKSRSSIDFAVKDSVFEIFLGVTIQKSAYHDGKSEWYQSNSYTPEDILAFGKGVGVSEMLSGILLERSIESDDPEIELGCAIQEIEEYLLNLRRFRDDFRQFKSTCRVELRPGGKSVEGTISKPRIRVPARVSSSGDAAISSRDEQPPTEPVE